jgi:hypothetical protein
MKAPMKTFYFWFGTRLVGVANGMSEEQAREKVLKEVKMGINFNPESAIRAAIPKHYPTNL